MSHESFAFPLLDTKTRRKLLDARRMKFRRAIERYCEQQHLLREIEDFPEGGAMRQVLAGVRKSVLPGC